MWYQYYCVGTFPKGSWEALRLRRGSVLPEVRETGIAEGDSGDSGDDGNLRNHCGLWLSSYTPKH